MKEVYNTQRKSEKDAFHSELKSQEIIKKIKYKKTYTQMYFFFKENGVLFLFLCGRKRELINIFA